MTEMCFAISEDDEECSPLGKKGLKSTRLWHNYQITTSNL